HCARVSLFQLSYQPSVDRSGIEPPQSMTTDLQSATLTNELPIHIHFTTTTCQHTTRRCSQQVLCQLQSVCQLSHLPVGRNQSPESGPCVILRYNSLESASQQVVAALRPEQSR